MSVTQTRNGLVDLDHPEEEERTVRDMVNGAASASERCVAERPVTSALVALGAGAFVGLVAAATIGRREAQRRESYLSRLGSQIASSVNSRIPDSIDWNR